MSAKDLSQEPWSVVSEVKDAPKTFPTVNEQIHTSSSSLVARRTQIWWFELLGSDCD